MFDAIGLGTLDSREQAIAVWVLAFACFALSKRDIRQALGGVIRAFVAPKLLLLYVSAGVYTAGVVYGAHLLGLWHPSSLKETLYWFVGGALVFVGGATHAVGESAYFKRTIRRAVKLTIVIEFVVGFYVLPFVAELLLVPVIALLVGMSVVSERDSKLDPARRVVNGALVAVGLAVFAYAAVSAVGDLDGLFTFESAEDLLVAPALTIALVPFLYLVGVLSAYEQVFMRIDFFIEDGHLAQRTRWAIVRACRLSLRRLAWLTGNMMMTLGQIGNERDLGDLIDRLGGVPRSGAAQHRAHDGSSADIPKKRAA